MENQITSANAESQSQLSSVNSFDSCNPSTDDIHLITWRYSKTVMSFRRSLIGKNNCKLFCKGEACKYENPFYWSDQDMAIPGLYSHWVTNQILAMSRPTTRLIKEFNLIENFKRFDIKSVICVQLPGEHAYCGQGNELSGFSYDPQLLMDANIFFYNFGWEDFEVPTMTMLLDVVRVMDYGLRAGNVAVHCHAGVGRTGVLIACYLVYTNRYSAKAAITLLRARRQGAIQTEGQVEIVRFFRTQMEKLWQVYPTCDRERIPYFQFLDRQRKYLHGDDLKTHKCIPKIVTYLCDVYLKLCHEGNFTPTTVKQIPHLLNDFSIHSLVASMYPSENLTELEQKLSILENKFNSVSEWNFIGQHPSCQIWALLLSWFYWLKVPCVSEDECLLVEKAITHNKLPWAYLNKELAKLLRILAFTLHKIEIKTNSSHRILLQQRITWVLITVRRRLEENQPEISRKREKRSNFLLCTSNTTAQIVPFSINSKKTATDHLKESAQFTILNEAFNNAILEFQSNNNNKSKKSPLISRESISDRPSSKYLNKPQPQIVGNLSRIHSSIEISKSKDSMIWPSHRLATPLRLERCQSDTILSLEKQQTDIMHAIKSNPHLLKISTGFSKNSENMELFRSNVKDFACLDQNVALSEILVRGEDSNYK